jgi:hypothetical protein
MPPAPTGSKPPRPKVPEGFQGGTGELGVLLQWPTGSADGTPVAKLSLEQLRARGITEKWAREEAANYRAHDAHNPLDPTTGRGNPTAARRAAWLEQLADRLAAEPGPPPTLPGSSGKPPHELTDDEKWAQHEAAAKAQEEAIEAPVSDRAREIAEGHAWTDHRHEFPEAHSKEEFAEIVNRVIDNPAAVTKTHGKRTAYWDRDSGTIVIVDPDGPHGGTAMRPSAGEDYFRRWPDVGP